MKGSVDINSKNNLSIEKKINEKHYNTSSKNPIIRNKLSVVKTHKLQVYISKLGLLYTPLQNKEFIIAYTY